jgi:hypothetical protein
MTIRKKSEKDGDTHTTRREKDEDQIVTVITLMAGCEIRVIPIAARSFSIK